MTKDQVQSVLDRVHTWSQPLQEQAVEMLLALEALPEQPYVLSEDERRGVERGFEDVRKGRFASDEHMAALFARYRL